MAAHPFFARKRILLLDKAEKNLNDRTWCFWEIKAGCFEPIVYHRWQSLWLRYRQKSLDLNMGGYTYKMIRSIDFYEYALGILKTAGCFDIRQEAVKEIQASEGLVITESATYQAPMVFSSVMPGPMEKQPGALYLLQHFKGWWVETDADYFDPQQADFMNFETSQQHGCTFIYYLPVSRRLALVEHTLFNEEILPDETYDEALHLFMSQLPGRPAYRIHSVEKGVIPMTSHSFPSVEGKLHYLGTAGGQTKPSTGYTYQFIQKHSQHIVDALVKGQVPKPLAPPRRFRFYDRVLLRVLQDRKMEGAAIFYQLFHRNPAHRMLRFLDNETGLAEELKIMASAPTGVFMDAARKEW
jgi:lycopene beta-cyclase